MDNNNQTIFERTGGTYTLGEDGISYPDLVLNEAEPRYGKYGSMRRQYLKKHRKTLYSDLLLSGKLVEHLNEVDDACNFRMDQTVTALAQMEGVTEELKADNQMKWIRRMNSIVQRAEEAVCHDLIYK